MICLRGLPSYTKETFVLVGEPMEREVHAKSTDRCSVPGKYLFIQKTTCSLIYIISPFHIFSYSWFNLFRPEVAAIDH